MSRLLRFALLVPCRNEQEVIRRKLENIRRLELPPEQECLVLVIDDHSTDGTGRVVEEYLGRVPGASCCVELLSNRIRPGKNGAIETGIAHLAGRADVVVLSDADVLVNADALNQLSAAFQEDQRLGMLCATQVFVHELPDSGDAAQAAGGHLACEAWDRVTRSIRRIESHWGKLFSVHGQWLAWRADLQLSPAPGVAADDVDLMLQARVSARPWVRMLPGLFFYETKPEAGTALDQQALRRARAWFQVFARPNVLQGWRGLDRLQGTLYAWLPGMAPGLAVLLIVAATALSLIVTGPRAGWLVMPLLAAMAFSGPGRAWRRTLGLIHRAKRLERAEAMEEAWEMSRE